METIGIFRSGNHFAEFGIIEIAEKDEVLGVDAGKYVGFLTHSGSRALGANIANHYTKRHQKTAVAGSKILPGYRWMKRKYRILNAMNLAGEYACLSPCNTCKIAKQLAHKPIKMVENHHNLAWKEQWEGKEVIVHRKALRLQLKMYWG